MLHRFFAHISLESTLRGTRARMISAVTLTLVLLFGFASSAGAVRSTAKSAHLTKHPHTTALPQPHLGFSANKSKANLKAHPNLSSLNVYFANFQQTLLSVGTEPAGVVVDSNGVLYSTDWETGAVYKITTPAVGGGHTVTQIATLTGKGPEDIAVDIYGDLFIADDGDGVIYELTPTSGTAYTVTPIASGFDMPWGVAVSYYGDTVFVTDSNASTLSYIHYSGSWGTAQLIDDTLSSPKAVAIDSDWNIYLVDGDYNTVITYSYTGSYSWGSQGTLNSNLTNPLNNGGFGITYDSFTGKVYATDFNGEVFEYDPIPTYGGYAGFLLSTQTVSPEGITTDPKGNVYIAEDDGSGDPYIYEITNSFGSADLGTLSGNVVTANFVVGGTGTVGNSVAVAEGWSLGDFNVLTDGCSGITVSGGTTMCSVTVGFSPYAVGPRTGGVYVTDSSDGSTVADSFQIYGVGVGAQPNYLPGTYDYIGSTAYYGGASVPANTARQKYNLKSPKQMQKQFKPEWLEGTYPGLWPTGIVVDLYGDIYVADEYYNQIYASYDFGTSWTELPLYPEVTPSGALAVDGAGNVYFGAWINEGGGSYAGVLVDYALSYGGDSTPTYDLPNVVVMPTSSGDGYLYYVSSIALDSAGNVYFTGSDDGTSDAYVYKVPVGWYEVPETVSRVSPQFSYLTGVSVDSFGDIYTADYFAGTLYSLYPDGFGSYSIYPFANGFDTPSAVQVDNNDNVYVLDSGDDTGVSVLYEVAYNGYSYNANIYPLFTSPYSNGYAYYWNFTTDPFSDFFFTDFGYTGGLLTLVDTNSAPTITFDTTTVGVISDDSPELVGLVNTGNQSLYINNLTYYNGNNFTNETGAYTFFPGSQTQLTECAAGSTVTVDNACGVPFVFDPSQAGTDDDSVTLSSNAYNNLTASPKTIFATRGKKVLPAKAKGNYGTTSFAYLTGTATQATPAVALISSLNPTLVQNTISFGVNVTGATGVAVTVPTGTITLTDGSTVIGTGTLDNGTTTILAAFSTTGAHSITATYSGDTNYIGGSATITQNVIDFTINFLSNTNNGSPIPVGPGQSVTVNLNISLPGYALPSAVTFSAAGGPDGATYVFNPTSIAAGSTSSTGLYDVLLTITIPAQFVASNEAPKAPNSKLPLAPLALAALLLPLAGKLRKAGKRLTRMVAMAILVIAGISATVTLSGCGANTTATYEIFVTATSGTLSHTTSFDLKVK